MSNAMQWGQRAASEGYLNLYETVRDEHADASYGLDYPPLRLAVVTVWGHYLKSHYPDAGTIEHSFRFNAPFLLANLLMEALTAVAIFLLVRRWLPRQTVLHKWVLPSLAAWWFWFNPAIWISSFARPAGDIWIAPFYLLAMWLASTEWWFAAGITIAIGTMFKGQQLTVAPLFILWPIFRGRISAPLRIICGFLTGAAAVLSPWMLSNRGAGVASAARMINRPAIGWIAGICLCIVGILLLRYFAVMRKWHWIAVAAAPALLAFIWPSIVHFNGTLFAIELTLSTLLVAMLFIGPRRLLAPASATAIAIALLLCMWQFHGSTAWYEVGYRYGVAKFPMLEIGGSSSIAGILQNNYHWSSDDIVFTLAAHALGHWQSTAWPICIRDLLAAVFGIALILCAIGLALQQRRNSRYFLVAVAAPWLAYFTIAPLMHERYLLWATAACACSALLAPSWFLLALIISLASWMMTIQVLIDGAPRTPEFDHWLAGDGDTLHTIIAGTYPGIGWMLALCTCIYIYVAIAGREKLRRI